MTTTDPRDSAVTGRVSNRRAVIVTDLIAAATAGTPGGALKTPDYVQGSAGEEPQPEPEPDPGAEAQGLLRNDSPHRRSRRISVIVVLATAATAIQLTPFWPFPTAPLWPTGRHLRRFAVNLPPGASTLEPTHA